MVAKCPGDKDVSGIFVHLVELRRAFMLAFIEDVLVGDVVRRRGPHFGSTHCKFEGQRPWFGSGVRTVQGILVAKGMWLADEFIGPVLTYIKY